MLSHPQRSMTASQPRAAWLVIHQTRISRSPAAAYAKKQERKKQAATSQRGRERVPWPVRK